MKRIYLLPQEGTAYKASLHCHTVLSDGHRTPEEIAEAYREKGYHIVAFSDHRTMIPHPELKTKDFLPLNALEIDVTYKGEHERSSSPTFHLNLIAENEQVAPFEYDRDAANARYGVEVINELIAKANEMGYLVQYNHPRWSLQDLRNFLPLKGLWGFEVFNTGCEREMLNGWADEEFMQMLQYGYYTVPTVGDDNHNRYPFDHPRGDSFGGFSVIKAKELTYEAVIEAMKRGDCYATTGPMIHALYVEDGVLHIETDPVCGIFVRTDGRRTAVELAHEDTLTCVDIPLERLMEQKLISVIAVNSRGQKAITRAYLKEEWAE